MPNKVSELKSALGAGARLNKYRINFTIPSAVPTTSDLKVVDTLCKSASFPAMTLGVIEVFNQGRKLIIPGDTTYDNTWDLTFYNTEDHALRKDMIAWMKAADNFQDNSHSGNPTELMTELSIEQLDSAGNPTVKYTFHNVFASVVSSIDVADDPDGGISEFTVTFAFSDWVIGDKAKNDPKAGNSATENAVSAE